MKQVWKRGLAMALAGCMMALSVPVMGVVAEEEEILVTPPASAMPDDDDPISTSTGILSTTTYSTTTTTTANTSYSTPSYTMTAAPIVTEVSYFTTFTTAATSAWATTATTTETTTTTTTTETTTTTTEETTTTTETTIESTTTETTTTETVPRPEIIRKGDVTIAYTDGGTASMGTDNDGVSIRKNIYNQWGNNVADIDGDSPVLDKITIEFSIEGLGDRSSNLDEDGNPTDAYYAYIAGSVGSNGSWDRESDTAPCAHVPITGDGTYTVVWNLNEGSDNIDCLMLQTNINMYDLDEDDSRKRGV